MTDEERRARKRKNQAAYNQSLRWYRDDHKRLNDEHTKLKTLNEDLETKLKEARENEQKLLMKTIEMEIQLEKLKEKATMADKLLERVVSLRNENDDLAKENARMTRRLDELSSDSSVLRNSTVITDSPPSLTDDDFPPHFDLRKSLGKPKAATRMLKILQGDSPPKVISYWHKRPSPPKMNLETSLFKDADLGLDVDVSLDNSHPGDKQLLLPDTPPKADTPSTDPVWPPVVNQPAALATDRQAFCPIFWSKLRRSKLLRTRLPGKLLKPLRFLAEYLDTKQTYWGKIENGSIRRWILKSNSYEAKYIERRPEPTMTGTDDVAHYAYMKRILNKAPLKEQVSSLDSLVDRIKSLVGCTNHTQPETVAIHQHEGDVQTSHMDTTSDSVVCMVHLDPSRSTEVAMTSGESPPACWLHLPWASIMLEAGWASFFMGNWPHRAPSSRTFDGQTRTTLIVIFGKETSERVYNYATWRHLLSTSDPPIEANLCATCPTISDEGVLKLATPPDMLELMRRLRPHTKQNFFASREKRGRGHSEFNDRITDLSKAGLRQLERLLLSNEDTRLKLTSISFMSRDGDAGDNTWHIDTPEVSLGPDAVILIVALEIRWKKGQGKGRDSPFYTLEHMRKEQDTPDSLKVTEGMGYLLTPFHRRDIHRFILEPGTTSCVARIGGLRED